jgi:hypothetical protein
MSVDLHDKTARWLRSNIVVTGSIVRGVRFADETFITDVDTKDFPALALEQAWRVVADTYQVLSAQRIPPTRLNLVYDKAVLHCVRRSDGAIMGIFAHRKAADVDMNGVNRLFNEFMNMV